MKTDAKVNDEFRKCGIVSLNWQQVLHLEVLQNDLPNVQQAK